MKKSSVLIRCVLMTVVISLSMISCNQNEIDVQAQQETASIMGAKLDLINNTLSFDNEESLKNLLSEIKKKRFFNNKIIEHRFIN